MDQIACPHCGGYKVNTRASEVDPVADRPVARRYLLTSLAVCGCIAGAGIAVASAAQALAWFRETHQAAQSAVFLLVGVASVLLLVAGVVGVRYGLKATRKASINLYAQVCLLCGYQWSRRADEPMPNVTQRPDLRALGEQRLREQAEAQDKAAAAYWIEQQRKQ